MSPLTQGNIDLNAKDNNNKTGFQLANENGNHNIGKIIEKRCQHYEKYTVTYQKN